MSLSYYVFILFLILLLGLFIDFQSYKRHLKTLLLSYSIITSLFAVFAIATWIGMDVFFPFSYFNTLLTSWTIHILEYYLPDVSFEGGSYAG